MEKVNIKILLVDDDEDDFILTKSFLSNNEKYDFFLDWEHDYDNALKRIKENRHDMYLIDYRLGKASGIDLLKEAQAGGCRKPIIILTGQTSYQTDIHAMTSGASDYLVKGEINTSLLERAIRYNLDRYNNLKTLQEQEFKYRLLFERSLDAIFLADTSLNIIDTNFSFRELFKSGKVQSTDKTLEDIFVNKKDLENLVEQVKKKRYIRDIETALKDPEGKEIICLISISSLHFAEHEDEFVQGIIKDITALKQTEKELRNSEKLALTGTMVRTIAHEIRNPLTNILLSLRQLEKKIDGTNDKAKGFMDIATKNSFVINNLLEELLQSSNPGEYLFDRHTLNEAINAALDVCKDRIKLKNVKLETDLTEDLEPIDIDLAQLKRAFVNIIINSVEAMSNTEEPVLKISTRKDNEAHLAAFTDNGAGIESSKINKMFEPFFTGKANGMGLGLTTVQTVIQKHNAEIKIESEPGKGTTFTFYFKP